MALDKQTISNGRPTARSSTTQLAGRGASTPRASGSPASDASPSLRKTVGIGPNKSNDFSKEVVSTPVKAFLSSNITPRSGSRRSRFESTSPASPISNVAPDGPPARARPVSMIESWDDGLTERTVGASAHGVHGIDVGRNQRAQSVVSDGPGRRSYTRPLSAQSSLADERSSVASPEGSPKFFRADDVKPRVPSKSEQQRPILRTVFSGYTQDGREEDEVSRSSFSTSPPPENGRPKFLRANSSNDAISPSLKLAVGLPTRRSPHQAIFQGQAANGQQRAASPLKDEITSRNSSLNDTPKGGTVSRKPSSSVPSKGGIPSRKTSLSSPRRHTRLVSNSSNTIEAPEVLTTSVARRASLNTPSPRRSNHAKTTSAGALDSPPKRRNSLAFSDISPPARSKVSATTAPRPSSAAQPAFTPIADPPRPSSGAQAASSPSTNPPIHLPNPHPSTAPAPAATPPLSPTRPAAQSKLEHLNELAANARRERKVLDLEISNSSLLAINRTLEREMRKQKDELRRLRRTSRRTADSRVVSGATNLTGRSSMLSGTATTDDGGEPYSDELSSLGGFDDEDDAHSPTTSTSSPPPTRSSFARDTKRLQLDLSRHRALLVDSQKLNQAMKRSLDTTESLISEGKKALEYRVQISPEAGTEQPILRGRVLEHEDNDEELRQGLLSPGISHSSLSNPWDCSLAGLHNPTTSADEHHLEERWDDEGIGDPDATITLPADTPSIPEPTPPTTSPPPPKHIPLPLPSSSPTSPSKTGWDAIKADVKTPDGLRGVAGLGLGGYLQSLGGGFGGLIAGGSGGGRS